MKSLSDIVDEFQVIIDTAEGLTELRSLILGLAVRGKLVPQDPNDEPASELLKKVEAEKERLYEEGEISKPKKLKSLTSNELPFSIPERWTWTKLEQIGITQTGTTPKTSVKEYYGDFVPFIGPGDILNGDIDYENRGLSEKGLEVGRLIEKGSILMVCIGGSIGKSHLINMDVSCNQQINAVKPLSEIDSNYTLSCLISDYFQNLIIEKATGSATPILNRTKWGNFPFPIPPLAEQHRIVQKIESLFAEVDELEAKLNQQTKLDEKLQLAVNADVQQAPDAKASQSAWTFITFNFDTLYHTPEAIDNLKKNILNEAVRGRLVLQNPNDEPASELLKKIEAEKQRLYEEGEIRKPKDLPPVNEDEIPFEIPESWEWSRVGFFTTKLGAGKTPLGGKDNYQDEGIPFLRSQNVWNNGLDFEGVARIPDSIHQEMINTEVKPEDLLINITGASIGRCALVPSDFDKGNVSQHVCIIRLADKRLNKYFHFLLTSPFAWRQVMSKQVGISREGLSKNKIRDFLISLPPLEEQHRIVQRIEEIFAICDRFKAQLEQRKLVNERLVKGLVGEVLEGGMNNHNS